VLQYARIHQPDAIRLVLSGQAEHEAILRAIGPAHQFLSKPCAPDTVIAAITRAVSLRNRLHDDRLRTLIAGIDAIPSLTSNITALIRKLENPSVGIPEIAKIVAQDVGMTAKILQFVNSPCLGLADPVTNAEHAIAILGINQVRPFVLSAGVFAECDGLGEWRYAAADLMRHSVQVAVRARGIAASEMHDPTQADYAFLAGMLHDLGKLILMRYRAEPYRSAIRSSRESGLPMWQTERTEVTADHAELGAYLLALWGLPSPVVEAVLFHHHPTEIHSDGFTTALAVHAANAIEHRPRRAITSSLDLPELDYDYISSSGFAERLESWIAIPSLAG
jgi:putative nucleotidyltransferase with HDIG domain